MLFYYLCLVFLINIVLWFIFFFKRIGVRILHSYIQLHAAKQICWPPDQITINAIPDESLANSHLHSGRTVSQVIRINAFYENKRVKDTVSAYFL